MEFNHIWSQGIFLYYKYMSATEFTLGHYSIARGNNLENSFPNFVLSGIEPGFSSVSANHWVVNSILLILHVGLNFMKIQLQDIYYSDCGTPQLWKWKRIKYGELGTRQRSFRLNQFLFPLLSVIVRNRSGEMGLIEFVSYLCNWLRAFVCYNNCFVNTKAEE